MTTNAAWRQQIQQVDADILRSLRLNIHGGFDEERFGARVGFGNLKWQEPLVLRILARPRSMSMSSVLRCGPCVRGQVSGGGAGEALPRCGPSNVIRPAVACAVRRCRATGR